jgi:hypothetical protein
MYANLVSQILTFFEQNPLWALFAAGYFFLTFADGKERSLYFERTWQIISKPTNLQQYSDAQGWLTSVEEFFKNIFINGYAKRALDWLVEKFSAAINNDWKKIVGALFLGIMLLMFLIADAITIQNMAALLGFPITLPLPTGLNDYGFAIVVGTFFSLIASSFILLEILGKSEFTEYGTYSKGVIRTSVIVISVFSLVSSFVVVTLFGLRAFAVAATLPNDIANTINNWAQFAGNFLVRINAFAITAAIATEAIKSLQALLVILALPTIIIVAIFYYTTATLAILVRILIDVFYRTFLWIIWTFSFFIAKPLDKVTFPFKFLGNKFLNLPGDNNRKNDGVA